MLMKNYLRRGFILLTIYSIVALLVLMCADRIERLEDNNFSTENRGVELKIGK